MTDMEKLKATFDEIGVLSTIEGNKIVIDPFDVDGGSHEVTVAFSEEGKYHEFKLYEIS